VEIPEKKNNIKRYKNIVVIILVGGALMGLFSYFSANKKATVTQPTINHDTAIATVTSASFAVSINGYGRLVPIKQQSIVAYSPGVIKNVLSKPGSEVKPNTTIITLSNPTIERDVKLKQLKYQEAQAKNRQLAATLKSKQLNLTNGLKIKEASLKVALAEHKAKKSLAQKSIISSIQMEKEEMQLKLKRLEFEMAQADLSNQIQSNKEQLAVSEISLAIAKQQVEISEEKQQALNIVAGATGQLQQLENKVTIGRYVNEGEFLGIVADQSALYAELRVNATEATKLTTGMLVVFNIKGQTAQGHVSRISPSVVNNQIIIDALIDSTLPANARADMDIEASINLTAATQSLVVARHNKVTKANSTYQVLKQNLGSDEFVTSTIKVGQINQNYIQILQGSKVGDKLIFASEGNSWKN
jgi:multidrug resistance efflux pump